MDREPVPEEGILGQGGDFWSPSWAKTWYVLEIGKGMGLSRGVVKRLRGQAAEKWGKTGMLSDAKKLVHCSTSHTSTGHLWDWISGREGYRHGHMRLG